MRLPHLRIRTLMTAVVAVGLLCTFWSDIAMWLDQLLFGVYSY